MNELIYIILAVAIVAAVGCPFAEAYHRWKQAEREDGGNDVSE